MLRLLAKLLPYALVLASAIFAGASAAESELPYVLKWKRLLGAPVLSSPSAADSLLYVGSMDGHLYALRLDEGTVAWKHRTDAEVCARPALWRDLVISGGYDGYVYALDRATGQVQWKFAADGGITTDMVVDGEAVFFGSADYKLYALNAGTGQLLWQCKTRGQVSSTPAVDAQRVYFGSDDKTLRAVTRQEGWLAWEFETKGAIRTAPRLSGGRVYFGSNDRYAYALNASEGGLKWRHRIGGKMEADFVLLEGKVCLGSANGYVYALDASDGRMLWKYDAEAKITGDALVASDSTFYVGSEDGFLYRFSARSGKPRWSFETHSGITARPTSHRGLLLVGSGDGFLYALDLEPEFPEIQGLIWENWYEQRYMGAKTGYIHEMATESVYEGLGAIRLTIEEVDWENGFRRTVSERWVDQDYHLLAFEKHKREFSQHLRVSGKVIGDSLRVEKSLAGHTFEKTVAMPKHAIAPELLERKILAECSPSVGDTFFVPVFSYATLGQVTVRYAILDTSVVDTLGCRERRFFGEIDQAEGELRGIVTQGWVDDRGQVITSQTPIFHLTFQRVPRNRALSWQVQEEVFRTVSDVPIESPAKLNVLEVRLKLNVPGIGRVFSDDERQQVFVESDATARVLVRRLSDDERSAGPGLFVGEDLERFLQPTVYCQSNDPGIVRLAQSIVGDETNAWRATKRLMEWVYNNMTATETNVKFKSAVEVLGSMEGTCSEYAVLFVALARAAGMPSRVAVGLMSANGNVIGLHMWPEVHIGKWLGVDPSWNEMNINPAHIKITTGSLALEDMLSFDVPLQLALTQLDTVRVIRFDSEEGLRLVEADRLFDKATEAESRYEEEEAKALLHELGSYPPNSKTDDALLSLSQIYLRNNEVDHAIDALNVILEDYPSMKDVDRALYRLAMIQRDHQAKPDLALTSLQILVARYPDSDLADDALCTVGEIYEREFGDLEAARGAYRQVGEQYADTGWAIIAQNALERMDATQVDSPNGRDACAEP